MTERGRNFASWFRKQLRLREWTQADFARRIDVEPQTISKWARGERVPLPDSCDLIADGLSVALDIVLLQAGHRPTNEDLDPDDPRSVLRGLIDRVQWTDDRFESIAGMLRTLIDLDRKQRQRT